MKGLRTGVLIALTAVLAGGGGAYAAGQITSAQIKDSTITTKDIKDKTIGTADIAPTALTRLRGAQGPAGPAGPAGPPGATVQGSAPAAGPKGDKGDKGDPAALPKVVQALDTVQNNADDDTVLAFAVATCPDGTAIIGGAYRHATQSLGEVFQSYPDLVNESWVVLGYNWANPGSDFTEGALRAQAQCVPSANASKVPFAERHEAAIQAVIDGDGREMLAKKAAIGSGGGEMLAKHRRR